jgi:outer membrane usher protein
LQERLVGGRSEPAPLTLIFNGIDKGVSVVILRANDVLVRLSDFQRAAFPLPGAKFVDVDGERYVSVASLAPKITYKVDLVNLRLDVNAEASLLPHTSMSLAFQQPLQLATSDPSGFLDYSLSTNTGVVGGNQTNAFFQAGVSGGPDLFSLTGAYNGSTWRRGLAAFQIESQTNLTRMAFGEEVASTGMLGGGAVIAGFGSSRHFEFQPNYVFFPTAGVSGTVLVPTTADVYVNGAFLRTVELPPGQFNLANISMSTGSNVTQVVLHDASGNTQTINGSYYSTQALLRKGLTSFDYHVGFLRPNPFGVNDYYGPLAATGSYQLGVTDFVTAGARIEQTKNLVSGGPELNISVPFGQLALESGFSRANGLNGSALGAAYLVQSRGSAVTISAETMSANYATVSLDPNAPRMRSSVQESLTVPVGNFVSLNLTHSTTTFTGLPTADQIAATSTIRVARDLSIGLTAARYRGASFFGFGVPIPGDRWTVGVTANILLSRQSNLFVDTTNTTGQSTTDVTLVKNVPNELGFGYTLRGSAGAPDSAAATFAYHTQVADLQLLLNANGGQTVSTTTILSGSIVGFKDGIFLAPPIGTGYALAKTKGFPGTGVFVGDQYAGRTNRQGNLVVTNLAAYGNNAIGIDEMKDRIDVIEDSSVISVRPKIYAGVVAPFKIRTFHPFLGHVVVKRGSATIVPAFGMLSLLQNGLEYVSDLGSEGQFYFDGPVAGAYAARVWGSDLTCTFDGALPSPTELVTQLGTLTCEAQ